MTAVLLSLMFACLVVGLDELEIAASAANRRAQTMPRRRGHQRDAARRRVSHRGEPGLGSGTDPHRTVPDPTQQQRCAS